MFCKNDNLETRHDNKTIKSKILLHLDMYMYLYYKEWQNCTYKTFFANQQEFHSEIYEIFREII